MASPKRRTATETSGSGSSTISVSQAEMDSISATATTNTMLVEAEYISAGPTIIRTALRSLVARDIRSPVRLRWKYARSSRCSRAKKWPRRSYSISREAPMMTRRIQKRHTPPSAAMPTSAAAYSPSFPRVTPAVRSSTASLSTHGDTSWMAVASTRKTDPAAKRAR